MENIFHIEKLSEDILDENLVQAFKPIHLVQTVLGSNRVHIENRYVTPVSLSHRFYSSFVWVFNVISICDYVFECENILQSSPMLKCGVVLNALLYSIIALRNLFYLEDLNSQLYVKLQKIDRVLNMKCSAELNHYHFKICAFSTVITVFGWIAAILILNIYLIQGFCISAIVVLNPGISNYIDIALYFCLAYYIALRIDYLNYLLGNDDAITLEKGSYLKKINSWFWSMGSYMNTKNESLFSESVLIGVYNILECLCLLGKLFQYSIFSFIAQLLLWDLISMQGLITAFKIKPWKELLKLHIMSALIPLVFSSIIALCVCFIAQAITYKLADTRKLCVKKLSSYRTEKERQYAKSILKLLDAEDAAKYCFSIYNIFCLDASLPLKILGVTTTYAVVLLQFAFL